MLQGGKSQAMLAAGALIAGYGSGAAINVTTYLTTRYAGVRNFGKIFGLISSAMGLGAGLGPVIAGRLYDFSGAYALYLEIGVGMAVILALAMLRLGPYPSFAAEEAPATA
jgi:MFS family permease